MAVGDSDGGGIRINLYWRKVGPLIYAGKTAGNEVGRIGSVFPEWLWMRLARLEDQIAQGRNGLKLKSAPQNLSPGHESLFRHHWYLLLVSP